jgi:hypothetical protein
MDKTINAALYIAVAEIPLSNPACVDGRRRYAVIHMPAMIGFQMICARGIPQKSRETGR